MKNRSDSSKDWEAEEGYEIGMARPNRWKPLWRGGVCRCFCTPETVRSWEAFPSLGLSLVVQAAGLKMGLMLALLPQKTLLLTAPGKPAEACTRLT